MTTKNYGYCDLSLSRNCDINKLHQLELLGFRTVAINTFVEEPSDEPKKKKKKGEIKEKQDYIPTPVEIPENIKLSTKLNILQRVTIEFSDSSISHKINKSENLKKYDLIAVLPKTLQAFQYTCSTLDADIITFESEAKIPFKISRKMYLQAVDRGLFFELMYSPIIRDSTARKNIISTAHNYHAIGKSKNIIVSSNAEDIEHTRGPYDVINMGFLLGLNNIQSLETIRNNPRRVILKSEGRRSGKFYVNITEFETKNDPNKMNEEYLCVSLQKYI